MNRYRARSVPLLLAGLLFASLLFAGCSSQYPTLTFTSKDNQATLTQPYAISAMSRDKAGDWDVVLVSQGLERPRPLVNRIGTALNPIEPFRSETAAGRDLIPGETPPIRQVVHMKLHWRPSRGAKANNPAAANATVRWLIFGSATPTNLADSTANPDILEYQGTAFVRPFFEDDGYTLLIRAGDLRRTQLRGDMVDALGPSSLDGKFYVPDDAATVANVLRELPPPAVAVAPPPPLLSTTRPTTRKSPTTRRGL